MATTYLPFNPSLPKGAAVTQIIQSGDSFVDLLDKWVPTLGNMIDGGIPASGDSTKFAMVASMLGTGEAGPNYPIAKAIFDRMNGLYIAMGVGNETGAYATIKEAASLLR